MLDQHNLKTGQPDPCWDNHCPHNTKLLQSHKYDGNLPRCQSFVTDDFCGKRQVSVQKFHFVSAKFFSFQYLSSPLQRKSPASAELFRETETNNPLRLLVLLCKDRLNIRSVFRNKSD